MDQLFGEERRARVSELLQRLRGLQDIPVTGVPKVEGKSVDRLSGYDRNEVARELQGVVDLLRIVPGRIGREERAVVPRVDAAVGDELEPVGWRRAAVASGDVAVAHED